MPWLSLRAADSPEAHPSFDWRWNQQSRLQQRAQSLGLRSVRFEPAVPKQALQALIAQADAFVVAMQPLPELYRYGISFNKLFDYFLASRRLSLLLASA